MTHSRVALWRGALLLYAWVLAGLGGGAMLAAMAAVRRLPATRVGGGAVEGVAIAVGAGFVAAVSVTLLALARSGGGRAPLAARDVLLPPLAATIPLVQVLALVRGDLLSAFLPPAFAFRLGDVARVLPVAHLALVWSPLAIAVWLRPASSEPPRSLPA